MHTQETTRGGQEKEGLVGRRMRRRRGWVRLKKIPVTPRLEARTEILKVLILKSYHPSKLIMMMLEKIMKCDML